MFKNFYNFNFKNLIRLRLHLGHKETDVNKNITNYLYGFRHEIAVYNLEKL